MSEGGRKFSKQNKYVIMLLLIALNIIFRIPTIPNELGVDSYKIHSYANLISQNGFANWVIDPLSIFGMYPFSTPIAVPFLQSGISQSTDLSMKYTILVTSIVIGLIGMTTSYVMAREIKNDDLFTYLVAFSFSLSPLFLSYTIWTTSTRHLFMALLPIFVWSLLRFYSIQKRWKYAILAVILFLMLAMTHHMFLLLAPFIISYILILILKDVKIELYISNNVTNLTNILTILYVITYAVLILIQAFKIFPYNDFNIWWKYQSGTFFHGSGTLILIGNMIVDYASSIGILSILMIIGAVSILRNSNRDMHQNLLLITLLAFAPIIMLGTYTRLVLLPFFCVLIAYGALNLYDAKLLKKYKLNFISVCILISIVFSIFMLSHWNILIQNQKTQYLEQTTEEAGTFLKDYHTKDSSFVSNFNERKISAASQIPYPPPDTAYMFNLINESDLKINSSLSLSNIKDFSNPDNIYKSNFDYRAEYGGQSRDIDSNLRKLYNLKYNIRYVVQNNKRLGKGFTNQPDAFYTSVNEKKSRIYDNNDLSIWYIWET